MGKKYEHLVKTLSFKEGAFGKYVWLTGNDLAGLDLNIIRTYSSYVGEWKNEKISGHIHPCNEIVVLDGFDFDRSADLGAEIELSLGEEAEKYTCNSATLAAFPAGLAHNPMVTKKVNKPYGVLTLYLGKDYTAANVAAGNGQSSQGNKYCNLVTTLDMKDAHRTSGGNADFIAGWSGKDLKNFELNVTWAFHKGLGAWHDKDPHVHGGYDECLFFVGTDPEHPEYLGAELEIHMGEEQEVYIFNKPTVVTAPRGVVHCPVITRAVEKPYNFSAICLSNAHDTTWLGGDGK